mmetsp:Transcript_24154/g.27979  ORF Transcript_24154/g.27979 Transcript_24154/m.27979 type:complete len:333 (-) Transcript_24154:52-1050(-)
MEIQSLDHNQNDDTTQENRMNHQEEEEQQQQQQDQDHKRTTLLECTKPKIIRLILFLTLLGFIIFVIIDSQREQHVRRISTEFLNWVEENPGAGICAFIGVYFAATVLFIPGSILTLGSGFVFANRFGLGLGLLFSTLSVFVGASTGSIAAFLLGRYLFRDCIQRTLYQKYTTIQAVDNALQNQGLKIMILLRLSPIVPFNAVNYVLGVTSVSLKHYSIACFAMLPGTILYTFLGSSAGSLVESETSGGDDTAVTIIVIVFSVIFGVGSIIATTYYAKKELNKLLAENEIGESNDDDDNDGDDYHDNGNANSEKKLKNNGEDDMEEQALAIP